MPSSGSRAQPLASDTQRVPWDERLTDEDLGKLIRIAIELARRNAGAPDATPQITVTVEGPGPAQPGGTTT